MVVKIQRPGLKRLFDIDLATLREVAAFLDRDENSKSDIMGIYQECADVLYEEIDYLKEVCCPGSCPRSCPRSCLRCLSHSLPWFLPQFLRQILCKFLPQILPLQVPAPPPAVLRPRGVFVNLLSRWACRAADNCQIAEPVVLPAPAVSSTVLILQRLQAFSTALPDWFVSL